MSEYNVFPSMNENLQFPPSVRAAIAAYPELLAFFAPKANPTFTGTVAGITKAHVGLSNVTNTSDANKPVSTAQQTALNLKANLASPTFTGTVGGITKAMVGLGSVDNTTDANKPVSTAQRTAIDLTAKGLVATYSQTTKIELTAETQVLRLAVPLVTGRNYFVRLRLNSLSTGPNTAFAVKLKSHTANDSTVTGTELDDVQTHYTANGVNLGRSGQMMYTFKATETATRYLRVTVQQATQTDKTFSINERSIDVYDMGAAI